MPLASAGTGIEVLAPFPVLLGLVAVAALVAIGALSHERKRPFSAALVYLAMGVIGAGLLRALGLRPLDLVGDHLLIERVTDVAIAVAVFSTGLRVRKGPQRRWATLGLLLGVTLPLTVAAVAVYATSAMGLSAGAAIILGAALAPTDPVLAGDIGLGAPGDSDEQARARGAITAEAGANDGAAIPLLTLGLIVAEDRWPGDALGWLATDLAYAIAVSLLVGTAVGWGASKAFVEMRRRDFLDPGFEAWASVALAVLLFALGESVGGYGFLAGFCGGLAFRRQAEEHRAPRHFHDGATTTENALELAVLLLLGSSLTIDGLGHPGLGGWLLAPLVLLIVRPATASLALIGSGLPLRERVYIAWFGVRGVAALNYTAAAAATGALATGETQTVVWTAVACVIASMVAHGTTATALARRLLGPTERAAGGAPGPDRS